MKSSPRSGLVVLWSAEAGAATREVRITRAMAAACVVAVSALVGVCLWLGWEFGHWSAKSSPARAVIDGTGELRAS